MILVYDITKEKSFKQLNMWYKEVNNVLNRDNYILAIVGNKKDLFDNEKVSFDRGKQFAEDIGTKFKLTSAKIDPLGFNQFLEELFIDFINDEKILNSKKNKLSNENVKKGKYC